MLILVSGRATVSLLQTTDGQAPPEPEGDGDGGHMPPDQPIVIAGSPLEPPTAVEAHTQTASSPPFVPLRPAALAAAMRFGPPLSDASTAEWRAYSNALAEGARARLPPPLGAYDPMSPPLPQGQALGGAAHDSPPPTAVPSPVAVQPDVADPPPADAAPAPNVADPPPADAVPAPARRRGRPPKQLRPG